MADILKVKRGNKENLPNLSQGEPAYVVDENELYIGSESGNIKLTRNLETEELNLKLNEKADKTSLHNHNNKEELDKIQIGDKVKWDAKSNFSGNYNDLTNKPENLATETYVDNKVAEAQLGGSEVDLSEYQRKEDNLLNTNNKKIVNAINEIKSNIDLIDLTHIDAVTLNGKSFSEPMSKEEYDAITNKDQNVIYLVNDNNEQIINNIPNYSDLDCNKVLAVNSNGSALAWIDIPIGNQLTEQQIANINKITAIESNLSNKADNTHVHNITDINGEINANSLNGKSFSEPMSKEEYDAITNKNIDTIYIVENNQSIENSEIILTSPNGTNYRITISDSGTFNINEI